MKKVPDFSKAKGTPAKKTKKPAAAAPDTKAQSAVKAGRVVLAAALLGLPAVMVPQQAAAQSTVGPPISPTKPAVPSARQIHVKVEVENRAIKMPGTFTVMGVGDGHTIFKAADGSMFYLDPRTGDKRSVAVDIFIKIDNTRGGGGAGKILLKEALITSIVGRDATGNVVMRNARNETFTLDPRTGDKVFIQWPK